MLHEARAHELRGQLHDYWPPVTTLDLATTTK